MNFPYYFPPEECQIGLHSPSLSQLQRMATRTDCARERKRRERGECRFHSFSSHHFTLAAEAAPPPQQQIQLSNSPQHRRFSSHSSSSFAPARGHPGRWISSEKELNSEFGRRVMTWERLFDSSTKWRRVGAPLSAPSSSAVV